MAVHMQGEIGSGAAVGVELQSRAVARYQVAGTV
jgi:hypothetical protein